MAITYSLTSYSLKDDNGYAIADQPAAPFDLTLGDAKMLELHFNRLPGLGNFGALPTFSETLYFNPALYVPEGTPYAPAGAVPSFGYRFALPISGGDAPTFAEAEMDFFGAALTQKNQRATIERTTATNLIIRLYFDVLSNISAFVTGAFLDNAGRLIQPEQAGVLFLASYIYSDAIEEVGSVIYAQPDKLILTDGRSWPLLTNIITITGGSPIDGVYTVDTVTMTEYANDTANINGGTPVPATGFFSGLVATPDAGLPIGFKIQPAASAFFINTPFEVNILTSNDTANTATAPTLLVERSATTQTKLSSVESSDLTFAVNYAGLLSKARLWVQDRAAVQNETTPAQDAAYVADLSGAITTPAPNVFETTYTMPPANENGDYVLLIVWYDEAGDVVNSFANFLDVTPDQAQTAYPNIQSKIEDYLKEFGDYVKAPIYDRLRLSVFLDKSTYNLRSITGDFAANFRRWELVVLQNNVQVQIFKSETLGGNTAFLVSDSPTNLDIAYSLRIEQAWGGSQIKFQWYFYFDNGLQSDRIGFYQLLDAHSELKNLIEAEIYDYAVTTQLDNFCGDLTQIASVLTASTGDNYAQMAVLVLPQIQEEESYNTNTLLPQLNGANLQDVDAGWIGGFAVAKFDVENIRPDSIVILSKEIQEEVETEGQINYQIVLQP